MQNEDRAYLKLVGSRRFHGDDDLYKVVDFLNKTLKERNLIFGLSKDRNGMLKISIYEA
jgi:hypothetical protein